MRPRFFDGLHRCLPALAAAGNGLIIEFRACRECLATLLDGLDVFLISVHRDLAEIDHRERDWGDRRIGEGRPQVETDPIHTFGPYYFEADTTNAIPSAVAASVLAAWRAGARRRALRRAYLANGEPYPVPVATSTRRGRSGRSLTPTICMTMWTFGLRGCFSAGFRSGKSTPLG